MPGASIPKIVADEHDSDGHRRVQLVVLPCNGAVALRCDRELTANTEGKSMEDAGSLGGGVNRRGGVSKSRRYLLGAIPAVALAAGCRVGWRGRVSPARQRSVLLAHTRGSAAECSPSC
ncbi:MAG: hypothetical protein ACPGXI_07865, partial [Mycobacterium sp.]